MIRRFRSKPLQRLFDRDDASHVKAEPREKLRDILAVLDGASEPSDLDLPGFLLHPLKGDLAGTWAITVRANWRVVFRFVDGDAVDVDYLDYH